MTLGTAVEASFVDAAFEAWCERVGHVADERVRDAFAAALVDAVAARDVSLATVVDDIRSGPLDGRALQGLVRRLFNNETYFFRDSASTDTLATEILPELIRQKRDVKRLQVWSAGCSSGEELFTVAILLHRLLPDIADWRLTLVGTDLSVMALHRARTGVYFGGALRNTGEDERRTLFINRGNTFELREKYRRSTYFCVDNLVGPVDQAHRAKFDLVLSRNVAIYLSPSGIERWAQKLVHACAEGGLVVTSPTDPLPPGAGRATHLPGITTHRAERGAQPVGLTFDEPLDLERVTQRRGGSTIPPGSKRATTRSSRAPQRASSVASTVPPQGSPRPTSASRSPSAARARSTKPPRSERRPSTRPPRESRSASELTTLARAWGDAGRLEEALGLLDAAGGIARRSAEVQELRGVLLEAIGRPDQAAEAYRRATDLAPGPRIWLRYGLVLEQLGLTGEAASALRSAASFSVTAAEGVHRRAALARLEVISRKARR